jgi:predicted AAA+ superfamily ATPase
MIGRIREQDILRRCLESNRSEFIALYGRRRVGKTYLVRETFSDKFFFYATGVVGEDSTLRVQLDHFNDEITRYGGEDLPRATNWKEAFTNLHALIERGEKSSKKVIFLDEVPWMATRNSGFLSALDYFWNRWISARSDVLLIICGSAASWITKNIINNRGGLHNRLTKQMFLRPFTLGECERYYQASGLAMTRFQMVEAYMIFGGIPYYLSLMDERLDLYQNVDRIYFEENAPLRGEYSNLFRSLFSNPDNHIAVVETLASRARGLTREEIIRSARLPNGGSVTKALDELAQSGFIRAYNPFGKKRKERLFQLTDAFTLFDVRFRKGRDTWNEKFWIQFSATHAHDVWSGYAFEQVCLQHIPQIKARLGISGVYTETCSWRSRESAPGAQIDLVIDRADNVINLCEAKYVAGEFGINKKTYLSLLNKQAVFGAETGTRKAVRTTLITPFGLKRGEYSAEFTSQVTMDDLFAAE